MPTVLNPPITTELPLASQPTRHPPGSDGKIEVMTERAALGWSIFHPMDNTGRDDAPTWNRRFEAVPTESEVFDFVAPA